MEIKCGKCNKYYSNTELGCPNCKGTVSKPAPLERPAPKSNGASGARKSGVLKLDCGTCKSERTMSATTIAKFSGFIRFIGYVIVIPSVLGILFAGIMFFSTGSATSEVMSANQSDAANAGAVVAAGIGFGFSLFVGFSSLVGGLIGWLLLMKKKVFKCANCGFILDRG